MAQLDFFLQRQPTKHVFNASFERLRWIEINRFCVLCKAAENENKRPAKRGDNVRSFVSLHYWICDLRILRENHAIEYSTIRRT